MVKKMFLLGSVLCAFLMYGTAFAGSYAQTGYTINDFDYAGWATSVEDYSGFSESGGYALSNILGELDSSVAAGTTSGGYVTVSFDVTITNGDGVDFVIWENGFGSTSAVYAELGYVSVSTDGVNWVTFASVSLTESLQSNNYIDPSDVYNLAGGFIANYGSTDTYQGTGFDLDDLIDSEAVTSGLVDLSNINYIMLTDVVSGTDLDSLGNVILDGPSYGGGADWNAVGVVNAAVPVPSAIFLLGAGLMGLIGLVRRQ